MPKVRDLQMACMPRPLRSVTSTYRGRPEPAWLYYGTGQEVPMKFMSFTLSVILRDTELFWLPCSPSPLEQPAEQGPRHSEAVNTRTSVRLAWALPLPSSLLDDAPLSHNRCHPTW